MKKKIIALLLTVVLCTMSLWGCGSSTYFTELKDLMTNGDNIAECTFEMKSTGNVMSSATPFDSANGTNIGVKTKTQTDDKGNIAVDIQVKMRDYDEYDKVTTVIKEGKNLYFTTADLLAFIEKYNLDPTGQIKAGFEQVGVKDWCKIDLEMLFTLMKMEYDDDMFNVSKHKDDVADYIDEVVDILDKDFNNLASNEGDNYTITVDDKNVSTAIDDLVKFLDKDYKTVYEKTTDLIEKILGDNMTKSIPKYSDISERVKITKDRLERKKSDTVKSFKSKNAKFSSEVNADKKTFTLSLNGEKQSDSFDVNMDLKTKKGNVNIKKLIPKDALDLTAVLKSLQSQTGGYSNSQIGGFSNNSGIATY